MKAVILFVFIVCSNFFVLGQTAGFAFAADSTPVYYRTFGSGKPLLIINGGPGMNSNGFEGLAKDLSANYRTIIYDQRGTGKSILKITDSTTITMDKMLGDIESLRKHLGIKKWSVLGHSFGGMLASYYITKHPQVIDKVVLSSSGGIDLELLTFAGNAIDSKLSAAALDSIAYWNRQIDQGDTTHYARLQRGRLLAPAYVYDEQAMPVIAERLTQSNFAVNSLVWQDLNRIHFDCAEGMRTFKKPVLIIQGKDDIINAALAEKAHKALKNSRVVFMDHCIHYGWIDNREVYFKELNTFLAG